MNIYHNLHSIHPAYRNTYKISHFITYHCTFMNMNMQNTLSKSKCVVIMPILVWIYPHSQNTASSQPQ